MTREDVAVHEAGHAIVAESTGVPWISVTIVPSGGAPGKIRYAKGSGAYPGRAFAAAAGAIADRFARDARGPLLSTALTLASKSDRRGFSRRRHVHAILSVTCEIVLANKGPRLALVDMLMRTPTLERATVLRELGERGIAIKRYGPDDLLDALCRHIPRGRPYTSNDPGPDEELVALLANERRAR